MLRQLLALALACLAIAALACTSSGKMAENPARELFEQHGWSVIGEAEESSDRLPADFELRSGYFPWCVFLDLSAHAGMDFSAYAGQEVKTLRFDIKDSRGGRLADKYRLQGMSLLNSKNEVIGAWVTYTSKDGDRLVGIPGYSLDAEDLEQVTGLTWPEYAKARSAKD